MLPKNCSIDPIIKIIHAISGKVWSLWFRSWLQSSRMTCEDAARCGHLEGLKHAHENGCGWYKTCRYAAENGHLDCLRYAHENGCDWDRWTCTCSCCFPQFRSIRMFRLLSWVKIDYIPDAEVPPPVQFVIMAPAANRPKP